MRKQNRLAMWWCDDVSPGHALVVAAMFGMGLQLLSWVLPLFSWLELP